MHYNFSKTNKTSHEKPIIGQVHRSIGQFEYEDHNASLLEPQIVSETSTRVYKEEKLLADKYFEPAKNKVQEWFSLFGRDNWINAKAFNRNRLP